MARRMLHCLFVSTLLLVPSAAHIFAAEAASDDFLKMIVQLIGDSDKEFRAAGLEKVRTAAKGKAATELFAAQLPKLDSDGQVALLSALGDRGDSAAGAVVRDSVMHGKDEKVRAAAIAALGRLGSANDLSLLTQELTASSSLQRAAAQRSLVELKGEAIVKKIAAEIKTAKPAAQAALIDVLATRRASDEMPAFLAASTEDSAQVRSAAMSALGQLGRPADVAAMIPGVLKAEKGSERDNAEKNVALVCSRIPDEQQRGQRVIDAIDTAPSGERDELLSLAGRVGGPTLINFVANIATSENPQRRQLGIDALSKWPDASVADKLLEIVDKSENRAERHQAFEAFVKIGASRDNRSHKERLERMKQAMKVAQTSEEQASVIRRTREAYDVEALRFVLPYVDPPQLTHVACETILEIAHHKEVRDPNKAEFDKALDKVIEVSKDKEPEFIERAERYKRGQTWERPKK